MLVDFLNIKINKSIYQKAGGLKARFGVYGHGYGVYQAFLKRRTYAFPCPAAGGHYQYKENISNIKLYIRLVLMP